MFKRFLNLFRLDMTVAFRNYFHIVVIILVVLISVAINFVFPKQIKLTPNELIFDDTEGKVFEKFQLEHGVDKSRFYQSREALEEELEKNNQALGIIMEGTLDNAKFIILHQGTESEEIINVLDATIEEALNLIRERTDKIGHRVEYLRPKSEHVPFNKNMIPVMVVTEAIMLGFLLISVMVFQEKEEGSVRAYRVSPGGVMEYILSKSAVNVLLALVYGGLVILFTMGIGVNYLAIFSIIILASFFMTLLGLSISVFFRNLQEFLFVGVFVLAVCGFPLASYLTPSFAPDFMTWLPSYPVLFGLREVLFPTGKEGFVASLNLMLLAQCAVLLAVSYWAVRKKLMREGR